MIAPALNDGLGEQSWPSDALWNWQWERVSDVDGRLENLLVGFAHELLAHDLDEHARSWSPLEHPASLLADDVERIEPLTLDLGRYELDVNTRPVIARTATFRYLARVLGNDLRRLFVCGRCRRLFATAEHQTEDGERQLGVVLRQLFGLLAEQPAFETLVFFTQVRVQLLVLVTLALSFLQRLGMRNRFGERLESYALAHA